MPFFKCRCNGKFKQDERRGFYATIDAMAISFGQRLAECVNLLVKLYSMMNKGYRLWLLGGGGLVEKFMGVCLSGL